MELRNNIRTNWATTGLELSKELKQFWQSSRPASPARGISKSDGHGSSSTSALAHLQHLDIPRSDSPGGSGASNDFAAGYSLGLIGGARSWVRAMHMPIYEKLADSLQMTRSRTSLRDSQPGSPRSEEDSSDARSPKAEQTPSRGRKGQVVTGGGETEPMDTTG